jgi:3-hydroxyacyl-[acyl-carrier-protein] dehydratase
MQAGTMPLRRFRNNSWQRECASIAYNDSFGGEALEAAVRAPRRRVRMIMDVTEIQKYLPHRYPFLMVDGILEIERLKRIVGVKSVSINEAHFQGHFPGQPVMPGVLIIESMAQTGGLLLLLEVPDRENKLLFFVAVDGARFRRPVVPGEQLRIEMNVLAWRGDFCKLEGKAMVDGQLAAEATLMCKMVDRDPAAPKAKDAK